jgi:hypothetical protein
VALTADRTVTGIFSSQATGSDVKFRRKNGVTNLGSPANRKGWEAAHQLGQRDLALEAVERAPGSNVCPGLAGTLDELLTAGISLVAAWPFSVGK